MLSDPAAAQPATVQNPGSGFRFELSYVSQQSSADCGAASLAMVIRSWGGREGRPDVVSYFNRIPGRGLSGEQLKQAALHFGHYAVTFQTTPAEAESQLRLGRPLIIALDVNGSSSHHLFVPVGRDRSSSRWAVHDPGQGPYRPKEEKSFLDSWDGTGMWALLLVSTGE